MKNLQKRHPGRMWTRFSRVAWIAFVALLVCSGTLYAKGERTEPPEQQKLRLRKGPYLQNLRQRRVTVMWETNSAASGTLIWATGGITKRRRVGEKKNLHAVTLEGLQPDTAYRYQVVSRRGEEAASGSGTFTTLPAEKRPFSFVVFGDNRSRPKKASKVVRALTHAAKNDNRDVLFALHTGDLIANGKIASHWQKQFFEPAAPLLRHLCVWPVLGNHERNSDLYFRYFSLPGNERWGSMDAGGIHFVYLDLHFSDFTPGSEQYEWLKNDLEENGHRPTVVTFHPSPFSSGPHARKNKKGEFAEKPIALTHRHLVPLFEKHSVRVVFSGHDHHYERSKKAGIYYIVQGMGGAPLRGAKTENPHSQKIVTKSLGYSLVRVRQDDMDILTRNADGKLIDRISVPLK